MEPSVSMSWNDLKGPNHLLEGLNNLHFTGQLSRSLRLPSAVVHGLWNASAPALQALKGSSGRRPPV